MRKPRAFAQRVGVARVWDAIDALAEDWEDVKRPAAYVHWLCRQSEDQGALRP